MEAGRPYVFVQIGWRAVRSAVRRRGLARCGLVGVRPVSSQATAWSRVARTKFNWLLRQRDCPQKATFTEGPP